MKGGPIKKPKKPILETMVKAMLVGVFSLLPASLKTIGTTFDTPKPTSIKAMVQLIK